MILISPFAQKLRNGMPNPKSPAPEWWQQVIERLGSETVVQLGVKGEPQLAADFRQNLPLAQIMNLVLACDTWMSPDSFLPHLAQYKGAPSGVVIWSRSDPKVFGYPENTNLLKDRAYLRKNTFGMWEEESYIPAAFIDPAIVANAVLARVSERRSCMVT